LQKAAGRLEWLARSQPDGKLLVEATNSGTAHVQVTGFEISVDGGPQHVRVQQMKYVLPGSRTSWTVDLPDSKGLAAAAVRIVGSSDQGDFNAQAALAPRL
jgi:P pilus assembly chaperone PapD